jgi:hypothetical protein
LGDGTNFGQFVCAEEIGFSEESEDGEERLCGADLVFEKFERVGESMAGGPTEGAESEGVEKSLHLVTDAGGAVLQVFVVEAHAGIDPDAADSGGRGEINLALKVFAEGFGVIG